MLLITRIVYHDVKSGLHGRPIVLKIDAVLVRKSIESCRPRPCPFRGPYRPRPGTSRPAQAWFSPRFQTYRESITVQQNRIAE